MPATLIKERELHLDVSEETARRCISSPQLFFEGSEGTTAVNRSPQGSPEGPWTVTLSPGYIFIARWNVVVQKTHDGTILMDLSSRKHPLFSSIHHEWKVGPYTGLQPTTTSEHKCTVSVSTTIRCYPLMVPMMYKWIQNSDKRLKHWVENHDGPPLHTSPS